jgi:hypothetical protein
VNDDDPPKLRIPFDWVVVDAVGALLAGLGVFALTGGDGLHPLLRHPAAAAACILVGVVLMGLALVKILRHMQASARTPRRAPPR